MHLRLPVRTPRLTASTLTQRQIFVCSAVCVRDVAPAPGSLQQACASRILPCSRRSALLLATLPFLQPGSAVAEATITPGEIDRLEEVAFEAYASMDLRGAVDAISRILAGDPANPRWREMRAQVLVDGKNFDAALQDFEVALELLPSNDLVGRARLIAGRALAYEGLSRWQDALQDYTAALDLAARGGESPDPYVINSRGNCYNSLGKWGEAREDYLLSSQLFQGAKGFRGRGGSTTQRLDGAVFASSNAALMLAQLGDQEGAMKEMERIARRAPGSADMRAALAALYWSQGRVEAAEDQWQFACDKISVGCSKYQDLDWLSRVRRWPPHMVALMTDFLQLKQG